MQQVHDDSKHFLAVVLPAIKVVGCGCGWSQEAERVVKHTQSEVVQ